MAGIRVATVGDVEQVYELLDARSRAAFGVSDVSRAGVEADFRRLAADRWVAEDRGRVVGYAHLTSTGELVHATPDADVGDALFARVERRARDRGFGDVRMTVAGEDLPLHAFVRRHGFAHERDVLLMWRRLDHPVPEPAWPEGVAARTYADADAERVHALLDAAYAAWDAAYVRLPHGEWLGFMTEHDEFDPALWFVVERDGELVACALNWKERQRRGWVKDIAVRASERGTGIGKALLHHTLRVYAEREVERVGLKVDATNPTGAPQLYRHVGFDVDRRDGIWRKTL